MKRIAFERQNITDFQRAKVELRVCLFFRFGLLIGCQNRFYLQTIGDVQHKYNVFHCSRFFGHECDGRVFGFFAGSPNLCLEGIFEVGFRYLFGIQIKAACSVNRYCQRRRGHGGGTAGRQLEV